MINKPFVGTTQTPACGFSRIAHILRVVGVVQQEEAAVGLAGRQHAEQQLAGEQHVEEEAVVVEEDVEAVDAEVEKGDKFHSKFIDLTERFLDRHQFALFRIFVMQLDL